jgi:hypothetical protein
MTVRLYGKHAIYNARMTGALLCCRSGVAELTVVAAQQRLDRGDPAETVWVDVAEVQSVNNTLTGITNDGWRVAIDRFAESAVAFGEPIRVTLVRNDARATDRRQVTGATVGHALHKMGFR